MAKMTLEEALVRGADGWATGGRVYKSLPEALMASDFGDHIKPLDLPAKPAATDLAQDLMETIEGWAEELETHWDFLAVMDGEEVVGVTLRDDEVFKGLLLAACERALEHFGHSAQVQYVSIDWIEVEDGGDV